MILKTEWLIKYHLSNKQSGTHISFGLNKTKQEMWRIDFNAPQKPFGKNLVLVKVVFPEPLLTNRGQQNTKNENPTPFLDRGIYRFSFFVFEFGTSCNLMWVTTVIFKLLHKKEKEKYKMVYASREEKRKRCLPSVCMLTKLFLAKQKVVYLVKL
jgi:hypothetical protein